MVEIIEEEEEEVEEETLQARPIIEPLWLRKINDKSIVFGAQSLIYQMGEAVSYYGDEMEVGVDFGTLTSPAVSYDADDNSIRID